MRLELLYTVTFTTPEAWSVEVAKVNSSEVRMHDAAQYTVSLPLRERDEGRDDALPAGLHAGISLR
jgi:hypothetical protein